MLVLEILLEKKWTRAQRLSTTWCVLEIRHVELKNVMNTQVLIFLRLRTDCRHSSFHGFLFIQL